MSDDSKNGRSSTAERRAASAVRTRRPPCRVSGVCVPRARGPGDRGGPQAHAPVSPSPTLPHPCVRLRTRATEGGHDGGPGSTSHQTD